MVQKKVKQKRKIEGVNFFFLGRGPPVPIYPKTERNEAPSDNSTESISLSPSKIKNRFPITTTLFRLASWRPAPSLSHSNPLADRQNPKNPKLSLNPQLTPQNKRNPYLLFWVSLLCYSAVQSSHFCYLCIVTGQFNVSFHGFFLGNCECEQLMLCFVLIYWGWFVLFLAIVVVVVIESVSNGQEQ